MPKLLSFLKARKIDISCVNIFCFLSSIRQDGVKTPCWHKIAWAKLGQHSFEWSTLPRGLDITKENVCRKMHSRPKSKWIYSISCLSLRFERSIYLYACWKRRWIIIINLVELTHKMRTAHFCKNIIFFGWVSCK